MLSEIKDDGNPVVKYEYDGCGRRIKTEHSDERTVTLYLGNDVVYEKTINSLGQLLNETNYIVVNGVYLAKLVKEGSSPQQLYFYHTDALGSVKAVTDIVGQCVKTFEYDEFGNVIMETGSLYETPQFTGKSLDSTGLYYFNARYYDPTLGRFISADPARQGLNWYVYCNNNPLIYIDPDGLDYSPSLAVQYALKYGENPNPEFALRTRVAVLRGRVADCTNFISQCINTGGIEITDEWYFYPGKYDVWGRHIGHSTTWTVTTEFYEWLSDSGWVEKDLTYNNIGTNEMLELRDIAEKGDLIAFLNEDGEVYHWALITDIENGAIMYAAHTDNVTRRPLKTNFSIKLIKLKRQNP